MKFKVCVIGAGKRIHEMYGPILSTYENVEIAGFWNRDETKGKKLSDAFGWKRYSNRDEMISECKPDILLVVVNSSALKSVVLDCLDYKVPIIMETPVWDAEIPNKSKQLNVKVLVNEQTPFLPCEEFKMSLIESGLFGNPVIAINDFRTFEFHGIAQLRRYLGYEKIPIEIVGSALPHYPVSFLDNSNNLQHQTEGWEFGTIKFNSNQIAVYNFSTIYNRMPFRKPRSTRIYCTKGSISSDDNEFSVYRMKENGETEKVEVLVQGHYMETNKISAIINNNEIIWKKPNNLAHLNDQQIAIRNVMKQNIDAISNSCEGYTCFRAAQDTNLLFAIRHSAYNKKYIA